MRLFKLLGGLLLVLTLALGLGSCGGGSVSSAAVGASTTITGSAGDGPITNGTVSILDVNGKSVAIISGSLNTGNNAQFSFTVPSGTALPLTITVSGGVDSVTGAPQDFLLKTSVTKLPPSGSVTGNANPLSTLIVEQAKKLNGGGALTAANLNLATTNTLNTMGFGLAAGIDPLSSKVTGANVASITKANEAVAELIRRTKVSMGAGAKLADAIAALAEDSTDGKLDGKAKTGVTKSKLTNAVAAKILTKQAQISAEIISDKLDVTTPTGTKIALASGANFANKMSAAITISVPTATAAQKNIANLLPTQKFINQAKAALAGANRLVGTGGNAALIALRTSFNSLVANNAPSNALKITINNNTRAAGTAFSTAITNAGTPTNVTAALSASVNADITAPTNQNTVFPTATTVKGGATVTIVSSATASNNVWLAPTGTTTFTASGTITKATNGTATSITAPANTGTYKVFVIDAAGNVSTASTATLTVDTTAPIKPVISSPLNNATVTTQTPTVTGTAEKGAFVQLFAGVTSAGTTMVNSSTGAWSITSAALTNNKNHVLTAKATDAAGNVSTASTAITITVSSGTSISGAVIDGKVKNATLTLFSDQAMTQNIGSGSTDATGAFNITLTAVTTPDPIYIRSVGGTDLDTGMPAPTMNFIGNTGGTNKLTSFNITPLTRDVFDRVKNGVPLATAQTNAQTAFGLASNTGTNGLYSDPSLPANTTLKTAAFKKLTAGTLGGTIEAGTYKMFAITLDETNVATPSKIASIAALTNPANGFFIDVTITVAAGGVISGSGGGNFFTGKIVGSSMIFNIVDNLTTPTQVTRLVGNLGLNGSVSGNLTKVSGIGTSNAMSKGVFVGTIIPTSGIKPAGLATFVSSFYSPGATSGKMNIVARDIFSGAAVPRVHWGQTAVTALDVAAGTVAMSNTMSLRTDTGSAATTPVTYTFTTGKYIKSATSIPTNLLVFEYAIAGGGKLFLATAVGLRRGIYFVTDTTAGATLNNVLSVGESYMSKVNSVAPNPFVSGATTPHTYNVTVADIDAGMPGGSRAQALTYGLLPMAVPGGLPLPSGVNTSNGFIDTVFGAPELMIFQGSMFVMKKDANNNFADNIFRGGPTDDHLRVVEFFESGAMQGEEIKGGTITLPGTGTTITMRNFPSSFVGLIQDQAITTTPSFNGKLHFLGRTIYASSFAGFANAFMSGTLTITAPKITTPTAPGLAILVVRPISSER